MNKVRSQRGFTLLEVLMVAAIAGLLASGIGATAFQLIRGPDRGNSSLTALLEIQNATYRISSDGQMAQTTDLVDGADPVDHMGLSWTDQYGDAGEPHTSSYYLSGTELQRDYDGNVTVVAHYVANIEFSLNERVITVTITCTPDGSSGVSEQKTFNVHLRAIESEE